MTTKTRLRWFAVQCETKRHVAKAGVGIARLGVKVFIPMAYKEVREGKWIVAKEDGLLFPPYLFIAMRANGPWGAVAAVDGVFKVMGGRNRRGDPVPSPIRYAVMRKIRTSARASERKKETARFAEGQKVKVVGGPFASFDGIFDRPEKERVRILLSIFGRETPVELDESDVRAA